MKSQAPAPPLPPPAENREQLGRRASFARWIESGEIHHLLASCVGEPRPDDDVLREQLAAAVEELNASTDPAERVELIREISALRERLGIRLEGETS